MNDEAQMEEAALQFGEHIVEFVYPIWRDENRKPVSMGSGFFVQAGHHLVLVSAAHVFDDIRRGTLLYIYADKGSKRALNGHYRMSNIPDRGTRDDDPIDTGVMFLSGPDLPPYSSLNKGVVPLESLVNMPEARQDYFHFFVGYPSSQSNANPIAKEVTSKPHSYLTKPIAPVDYVGVKIAQRSTVKITAESHIVMPFVRKDTRSLRGEPRQFPKPHGISGAPLFRLATDPDGGPKIVGVMTRIDKMRRVVIATDIRYALEMIAGGPPTQIRR